ncbi:MAG: MoxR family ATPase [Myxococcales bacterium]|nr:MoxR family ATPase [Myxococcales bacterium]
MVGRAEGSVETVSDAFEGAAEKLRAVRDAVETVIVGQRPVVEAVIGCLVAGGHGLLEGAPGLGKTALVRAVSEAVALKFSRVQCTPDLLPSDLTGTRMIEEDPQRGRQFVWVEGPLFGQLVLVDEVNRATPRTQSALLEAMAEGQVTLSGERRVLPQPFCVLATQNPIEMEGTYPLPEAQLDRFLLHIEVPRPRREDLATILGQTTRHGRPALSPCLDAATLTALRAQCRDVALADTLLDQVTALLDALDPSAPTASPAVRRAVKLGPGVRGGQALVLAAKARALTEGRAQVSEADLKAVAPSALRHRIHRTFEAQLEGTSAHALVAEAVSSWRA